MKKLEILWKLPKHDTEAWSEQMLLEKWNQQTCSKKGSNKAEQSKTRRACMTDVLREEKSKSYKMLSDA